MTAKILIPEETPSKKRLLLQFIVGLVIGVFLAIFVSFCAPHCVGFTDSNTRYRQGQLVVVKNEYNSMSHDLSQPTERVLCCIVTNRKHQKSRVQNVKRTWGRRCNKLIVVSWQNNA